MSFEDPDNNIAETEAYQIFSVAKDEVPILPAEHLYILRNTSFTVGNIGIIISSIRKLGHLHINNHSSMEDVRFLYDEIVSDDERFQLASADAITKLDNSLELIRQTTQRLHNYLLRPALEDDDPRGIEHEKEIVYDLQYELTELYMNVLMRRRAFIEYEGEVVVQDRGFVPQ